MFSSKLNIKEISNKQKVSNAKISKSDNLKIKCLKSRSKHAKLGLIKRPKLHASPITHQTSSIPDFSSLSSMSSLPPSPPSPFKAKEAPGRANGVTWMSEWNYLNINEVTKIVK